MESYVVAMGHVTVDRYCQCLQDIVVGDKFFVRYIKTLPGGMVANAACVLSALGTPTYFLSALGEDAQTRFLLDSFADSGIKMDHVKTLPEHENFCTDILLQPDGKERTIMLHEVKKPVAIIDESAKQTLLGASFVYGLMSDFRTLPDYRNLLLQTKRRGAKFMFDAECSTFTSAAEPKDRFFFELADILSFNTEAALQYCGGADETPLEALAADSSKVILITRGAAGCTVIADGVRFDVPCYSCNVVDTTGAGDTFNAAFLHAYMSGMDLLCSARFATAAANRCTEDYGARAGAAPEDTVLSFQKERESMRGDA